MKKEDKAIERYNKQYNKNKDELEKLQGTVHTKNKAKALVKEAQDNLDILESSLQVDRKNDTNEKKLNQLQLGVMKRKIERLEEERKQLKTEEKLSEIVAENEGVVQQIFYNDGTTVEPNQPIFEIQGNEASHYVDIDVEQILFDISIGAKMEIMNRQGEKLTAVLITIRQNDNDGKILRLEVPESLNVGDAVNVSYTVSSEKYDCVIPKSSLREDINGKYVLKVVEKKTPLGTRYLSQRVNVDVIAEDDTNMAVSGDVEEGECITTISSKPFESGEYIRIK